MEFDKTINGDVYMVPDAIEVLEEPVDLHALAHMRLQLISGNSFNLEESTGAGWWDRTADAFDVGQHVGVVPGLATRFARRAPGNIGLANETPFDGDGALRVLRRRPIVRRRSWTLWRLSRWILRGSNGGDTKRRGERPCVNS
jgi:hypothetical protein